MPKKKHKLSASSYLKIRQNAQRSGINMATPTIATTNFTRINACDSTTGWSNLGGGPGVSVNADVFIQGTGALGRRVDNGTGGYALDLGGSTLDFSPGGANEGEHIFFWVNILQPSLINSMRLRLSEDASAPNAGNSMDWEIFPANDYKGGWFRAVVDPRTPPSVLNGSATHSWSDLDAIRWIAFFFDMGNVGGTSPNCNIDAIDRGRGLIVTGGTALDKITWDDIEGVATNNTNAYGLIEKKSGVFFIKGEWQFGDASNNCYFEDTNQTIVFENVYTKDRATTPNTISAQAPELNKIIVVEGTGTTDFINGTKFGTGDNAIGINGCTYQVAPIFNGIETNATFDFSDADLTNIELFGTTIRGAVAGQGTDISIKFCSDATNGPNHEVSGCTFDQCGTVDPGRVSMQNNIFSNTKQASKYVPFDAVIWEDNSAASFTDITSAAADRDTGGTAGFDLTTTNTNDAIYFGLRDKFEGLDFVGSNWSDASSSPVWEYWDGASWTTITVTAIHAETQASATNTLNSTVGLAGKSFSWTAPDDWFPISVNGSFKLYYIRSRNTANLSTVTGTSLLDWTYAHTPFNGAALLWGGNIDIVNSTFISNTSATANENGCGIVHRSFLGTLPYGYSNLKFLSNDSDVLVNIKNDLQDSYSFTNEDAFGTLNNTTTAVGQSFTFASSVTILGSAIVKLYTTGSPTGNIVAKIYSISGTHGTNATPNTLLATSLNSVDVSTIAATGEFIPFFFDFEGVALTNYFLVLEYTNGTAVDTVRVATEITSPTHGGNYASFAGSWTASAFTDMCFEILEDPITISATSGANPTTFATSLGTGVLISTLINVTLTGLVASPATEVRVYETGTTNEIDGAENVVSGSFTFSADATEFVDIRIHNVEYEYIVLENFDVPATDSSIPIQQRFDRNYNNP